MKTLRGRGHQDDFGDWERYWRRYEYNRVEERTLAERTNDINAEMERLNNLSNGRLMLIRKKSLRIWRQNLHAALTEPRNQELFDRIVGMVQAPERQLA